MSVPNYAALTQVFPLTHQSAEPLECPRNADARVDLNQDTLGRLHVDLQSACLVERGVEKCEKTLTQELVSAPIASHRTPLLT